MVQQGLPRALHVLEPLLRSGPDLHLRGPKEPVGGANQTRGAAPRQPHVQSGVPRQPHLGRLHDKHNHARQPARGEALFPPHHKGNDRKLLLLHVRGRAAPALLCGSAPPAARKHHGR
eukprot:3933093-Rhodomonas_salina.1